MAPQSFDSSKNNDNNITAVEGRGETTEINSDSVQFTERRDIDGSVIYLVEHGECYTELASEQEIMKGHCGPELVGLFKDYLSAKRNGTSLSESVENTSPGDSKSQTKGTHTSKFVDFITAAALRSGFYSWLQNRDTASGLPERQSSLTPSSSPPHRIVFCTNCRLHSA